jgi:IclR family transcriptional regulator, mhp operon transcriptional activator
MPPKDTSRTSSKRAPKVHVVNVRSLQRGLAILKIISRSDGIKAREISERISIARPTVYRLLETLEEEGYVVRSASDNRFRVTQEALSLSVGYDTVNSISQVAGPVLVELGHRFIWPFDLSVRSGIEMQIQESTHPRSPLAMERGVIRRRLPMLHTAAGRSYVAFSSVDVRAKLVEEISASGSSNDRHLLKSSWLEAMVADTVARGYAVRYNDRYNPLTSSIAVPIFSGKAVIGSMAVIWITKALTLEEGVDQFFEPMRNAARRIDSLHGNLRAAK